MLLSGGRNGHESNSMSHDQHRAWPMVDVQSKRGFLAAEALPARAPVGRASPVVSCPSSCRPALVEELQVGSVGHGAVPGPGCLTGAQWQRRTWLPAECHLAQRAGDLYPVGFPKVSQTTGAPHLPLPSCSLFPTGRKQLQSGLAEPQGADLLGSGCCYVLPSLKRVCEIQDTSQPPTVPMPADASFPVRLQPPPFRLLRLL